MGVSALSFIANANVTGQIENDITMIALKREADIVGAYFRNFLGVSFSSASKGVKSAVGSKNI